MTARLCVLALLLISVSVWASEDEKKLLTTLFNNYDLRVRPVEKENDTLVVQVDLTLRRLVHLCPRSGIFEVNAWLSFKWQDYQLKWDPEQYGGIKTLYVPQSDIFKPDIVLYNSAKGLYEDQRLQPNKASIYSDGTTMLVDSVMMAVECPTNETQIEANCTIMLGSWVNDGYHIDLKLGKIRTEPQVIANRRWTVKGIEGKRIEIFYECCPEPYISININVNLTKNLDAKNDPL